MTSVRWDEFEQAEPDLAGRVKARFESHEHSILGTLDGDGAPRLSGIVPTFWDGGVWLGMMPGSRKGADLLRDPRYALHSAPLDVDLVEGDARLRGIAIHLPDRIPRFAEWLEWPEGERRMDLFDLRLASVDLIAVAEQEMVIESWSPEGGLQVVQRA